VRAVLPHLAAPLRRGDHPLERHKDAAHVVDPAADEDCAQFSRTSTAISSGVIQPRAEIDACEAPVAARATPRRRLDAICFSGELLPRLAEDRLEHLLLERK